MTHQKCNEDISLNLNLINRFYQGSEIKSFVIVEKSTINIESEIKRILNNPQIEADLVKDKDYEVYAVFNKNQFATDDSVNYMPFEKLMLTSELEEVFFF